MRRLSRALRYLAGGLVVLILLASAGVYGFSEARYRKQWTVTASVAVPTDSAAIARGAHLANSVGGCIECHGENLAGKVIVDDPAIGTVWGRNLTRGRGGVGAQLEDVDFVRAIRHAVGRDGRALKIMPSRDYQQLTEADLGAIIAYVKSRPPVDHEVPAVRVGPVARVLMLAGKMPLLDAERIDHAKPFAASVSPGPTAEYGGYLAAVGCMGCHGETLAGGPIASGPPDWPPAANLTPIGSTMGWTEADFRRALREGKRPNGTMLNDVMPWNRLTKNLTDEEIRALWLYVRSVPGVGGARQTAAL